MLTLHLAGCMTWQPVQASPREFVDREAPSAVRVRYADGWQRVLADPIIRNDSIVATGETCRNGRCEIRSGVAPLEGLTSLEVQRVDQGRSVLLGAVLLLGFPLVVFVASGGFCGGDPCELRR
jgi:hypothetical protein